MVQSKEFTHLNTQGEVHMVDISEKNDTQRTALAYGEIHMLEATAEAIQTQMIKKGEVLQVARVAGITAAKRTFEWIPLCHLVALTKCEIQTNIGLLEKNNGRSGHFIRSSIKSKESDE